ncbi:MAG: hypothetical protein AAF662_02840 [Pseudomonadota bacterium]
MKGAKGLNTWLFPVLAVLIAILFLSFMDGFLDRRSVAAEASAEGVDVDVSDAAIYGTAKDGSEVCLAGSVYTQVPGKNGHLLLIVEFDDFGSRRTCSENDELDGVSVDRWCHAGFSYLMILDQIGPRMGDVVMQLFPILDERGIAEACDESDPASFEL